MNELGSTSEIEFPPLHDPRYPVHRIADRLKPFIRIIVERVRPQRIILFGSYAYGDPSDDSDADLLVIRGGISSKNKSNAEILNSFWDVPGPRLPFTILTKTPERIAERLAAQSPFYQEILSKGLEVYAA